jgi:hypothetical protein
MARDFEDLHDIDEMDDIELRDLVRERIRAHTALDIDDITIRVKDHHVELSGRVGTDGERRVAEHVLTDTLGLMDFTNNLVVDPIARAESPMAIDDHLVDEEERSGTLLGDVAVSLDPEAEHLADEVQDDLTGTTDYTKVMEDGMTWNPPDSPTPEGMDASPGDLGEMH